jgi:GNAT superfamily N-acetyltransferase
VSGPQRDQRQGVTVEPSGLDAPEVQEMIRAMWAELEGRYSDQLGEVDSPEERARHDEFVPPAGAFVVAWVEGRPAGCGGVRRLDDGTAEVKRMYVAPDARRSGVARAVLSALEDRARLLGYRMVRLETGVRQPEAIALYRSSGYREIPCYGQYAGDELSRCFEKELGGDPTIE